MPSKYEEAQNIANSRDWDKPGVTMGGVLAIGAETPEGSYDKKRDIVPDLTITARIIHRILPRLIESGDPGIRLWFEGNKKRWRRRTEIKVFRQEK